MAKNNQARGGAAVATKPATKVPSASDLEALLLSDDVETVVTRQGRTEFPVADPEEYPESDYAGMDYDTFCTKIRALPPGGVVLLRSGKDFGGKLQSMVTRIKNAIENREKRGPLTLTKKEVKIVALEAGKKIQAGDKTIELPWNAIRIVSKIGQEN